MGDALTASTLADVDSYRYFYLNGNLTQSFREYVTDAGTGKTNPLTSYPPLVRGCTPEYGFPCGNQTPLQVRSKRSRFITLFQAAAKSLTNFSLASAHA